MLALVKTKKGKDAMELRDVPEPVIADDEVLIEVKAAGICGTDMHVKHDTFPYWPPVTMGHEFAGVIADRGGAVTGWEIGDRVIGEPHTLHCGQCYLCRRGYIQNCADKRSPGWGIDGAFTKYLKYPTKLLHRIPDGMTFSQAALVEPAANTVTDIIERKAIEAGDFIVLLGPGPIGLMAAQAARTAGAREILIVGAPADQGLRLDTARQLGFDNVIDFSKTNPLEKCLEMTAGIGADLVIECSGAPPAIAQTFELVRKWGRICAIGLTGKKPVQLDWDAAMTKNVTLFFNMSTTYASWEKTIWMVAQKKIDVDPLITQELPLKEWEQGFAALENMEALKVVLIP
jgi:L-iditol 2-dehydrogenase